MQVHIEALQELMQQKKWSLPELATRLRIDYSYLFRVINKEKGGGAKLFGGIYKLCKEEGLNLEDYIFLDGPLSTDNKIHKKGKRKKEVSENSTLTRGGSAHGPVLASNHCKAPGQQDYSD